MSFNVAAESNSKGFYQNITREHAANRLLFIAYQIPRKNLLGNLMHCSFRTKSLRLKLQISDSQTHLYYRRIIDALHWYILNLIKNIFTAYPDY